jgi:FtsP/CotA-like multicopper oxidase with cupredoxin domain
VIPVSKKIGRRNFLQLAGIGLGSAGLATLTTLHAQASSQQHVPGVLPHAQGEDWQTMDKMHKDAVDIFLQNIGKDANFWGRPLEFKMDGGVKVFEIVCQEVQWETIPGQPFAAFSYNGTVPGPEIRVTEGDKVRVNVTNQMTQSTAIHFHGVRIPNAMDGVPFVTQPVVTPGGTFTHEFTVRNFGTHMYHSHHNAAEQVTRGMLGAFIVEPKDKSHEPKVDAEYTMILNDTAVGFTLNGRGFPYTQPIIAKKGQKIRVRYMNEGLMIHPIHLHGIPQLVFAKDGYYLPTPYLVDTLNIAPGERYDVVIDCDEPGAWAFHCHILTHAESRQGMFGMVTALVVQE